MRKEVIIVNDFYKNPDEVIRYARSLKYYSPWDNNGVGSSKKEDIERATRLVSFFKKAKDCPFKSSQNLIRTFENIIGEKIDMEHWNADFPENPSDGSFLGVMKDVHVPKTARWNATFQVKYNHGSAIHTHSDKVRDYWNDVGENGWVGLIYLARNAPRNAGLTTYSNRFGNNKEWGTSLDRWQLLDDYANIFNRLILTRGDIPHTGGDGFGDNFENARLFQTFFFKTIPERSLDNCEIDFSH